MSERVVWGLDLGQTGLRAIKLERGKGAGVRLTDTFFCPFDGQPDDPGHEDKVLEALSEFVAAKAPRQIPVVLSLPGYATLFRNFPLPEVPPSKLREVVSYEAKQLIPYPLDEVQWDFQQLGINEETGELQIALLCCRRDIINNLLRLADEVGLVVEDVQAGPIALANFCLFDTPPQGKAMLLDCGARSTDIVMFDEESFWLRNVAVCGDDISRTLMNKFSISFEEAEQLKSNMNDPKQAGRVFKVVEPVIRSLAGEAQRSFGYYRSTKRGASVDEMILSGNTFLMEGADQYMADSLGYAARTMDRPATIVVAAGVDAGELARQRQVYGIAAGLGLQGLGLGRFTCSLLPDSRKLRKLVKKKEVYGWLTAAVIVITVLIGMVTTRSQKPLFERDVRDMQQVMELAKTRQREYEQKMKRFEPAQKRNRAMLDVEGGRGFLLRAADLVHFQIEQLNKLRFNKINPQPITNSDLSQKQIIENLQTNIMNWPTSRQNFEKLLKDKTVEFKIAEQPDEETKRNMQDNLQMQVLRRVAIEHNRLKRTFLIGESYRVVKATKTVDGIDISWGLNEQEEEEELAPVVGGKPGIKGKPGVPAQTPAAPTADATGFEKVLTEAKDVVLITLTGFTVTDDSNDLLELNNRLGSLKGAGLHIYNVEGRQGFRMIRDKEEDSNNTINLPKIYDPTPVKADFDSMGEDGTIDRSEKLQYEPFTKERITRFEARLIYEPTAKTSDKEASEQEEAIIRQALQELTAPPAPEKAPEEEMKATEETEATPSEKTAAAENAKTQPPGGATTPGGVTTASGAATAGDATTPNGAAAVGGAKTADEAIPAKNR